MADGSAALLTRRVPGADQTWFGLLEPAAASVRPLGVVPPGVSSCAVAAGSVVCPDASDRLRLWRFRT